MGNLPKLSSFPTNAYKALERSAHDSRYKSYKVYDWEAHLIFKEHFVTLIRWFNSQVDKEHNLDVPNHALIIASPKLICLVFGI